MTPTIDFDNDSWIVPSKQQAGRFYQVKCETNRINGSKSPAKKPLEFYILVFIENLKILVFFVTFLKKEN